MIPFMYWTNMSGIYDMVKYGNEYIMATFGGILITNEYLEERSRITFSQGLPSNVVVSIDTIDGRIWFLTKDKGFGYLSGGRAYLFPYSRIPITPDKLTNAVGSLTYDNRLILFGENWILELNPVKDEVRELFSDAVSHIIDPPIGWITVHSDSIYIGDNSGIVATSWNYRDIPASYVRIMNTEPVNYISFLGDTLFVGTINGLYSDSAKIISGVSVIHFLSFNDTLFISCRNDSISEVYSPGFILKYANNQLDTVYTYPAPFRFFIVDSTLYISTLSELPVLPYKFSRAYGLYKYLETTPYTYGIPLNFITNVVSDQDDIYVFGGREVRNQRKLLSFIGYNLTKKFPISPPEDISYSVRGANYINDTTVAISTPYAFYLVHSSGNLTNCYQGSYTEDYAFTGATLYRDTIFISALSGKVYALPQCGTIIEKPVYEVAGNMRHLSSNGELIAFGGDGGFAVFSGESLIFIDNTLIVKNVSKYKDGFVVCANDGAYIYDGSLKKLNELSGKVVVSAIEDNFGSLWIVAEDGIYQYDENLQLWEIYKFAGTPLADLRDWPSKNVISIYQDTLLLVGTNEGLAFIKIKPTKAELDKIYLYPNPAYDKLNVKNVLCNSLKSASILTFSGKRFKLNYTCYKDRDLLIANISHLKEGLYILELRFNEDIKLLKFMKR